jgi:hypothetical protein
VLQSTLKTSRRSLARQGLRLPFHTREQHLTWVHEPLVALEQGDVESGRAGLQRLVARLDRVPAERVLVTLEDLAEIRQPAIDELMALLAPIFDVHVVITARDWSRQIPSEWQQAVKSRLTTPFPEFVEAVVKGSPPDGERFLLRQHLPGIAARWGRELPPENVHVVAVPSSRDPDALFRIFGDLVGFDPHSLTMGRSTSNTSLGHEQAELLRQVNVALESRLDHVRTQYRPAVRGVLINGALRKQQGTRPALPAEHHAWCRQESVDMLDKLRDAGYDMVGDPDDLLVQESLPATEPDLSPEHLHQVAVQALADAVCANYRQNIRPAQERVRARTSQEAAGGSGKEADALSSHPRDHITRRARGLARRARTALARTKGPRP